MTERTERRKIPHDLDAERAVIGALLQYADYRDALLDFLAAGDFYEPMHRAIFAAVAELDAAAQEPTVVALAARLSAKGFAFDRETRREFTSQAPLLSPRAEAAIVAKTAVARRAIQVLGVALDRAWEGDPDAAMLTIEQAREALGESFADVEPPIDALDLADEDHAVDWIVHGLLARHETVLFVAEPGSGKTTLLNQIGMCLACGLHPWHRTPIPKQRVLVFDFQDARGARGRGVQKMLGYAGGRLDRGYLAYELRTQGIDLTQRADQRWFEAKVLKFRPDVIIAGPLYNMVSGAQGRSKQAEETAQLAASFLAQLCVRRNCALLIEAHAPHGEELRVRGSKFWEDWAGWGFGLKASRDANGKRHYNVVRFRGDRESGRQWPEHYAEGHPDHWPWEPDIATLPRDPSRGTDELRF